MVTVKIKLFVETVRHHPKGGISVWSLRSSESDVSLVFLDFIFLQSSGGMAVFLHILPFILIFFPPKACTWSFVIGWIHSK